ncbi:NAD(P)/FAD-dependent oxidoreductase [Streptomyces sp. GSL17-111]|uniref:NAD(P)/FAD-dependent oxidoreductase n=1 Tax=Streptomyces sp. GSL17-111 TaxID=3121596 RepID=UPI0030F3A45C
MRPHGNGRHLVVVGASLAGSRAVRALRSRGFGGTITVVGAERRPPYDRPPLSKGALTAAVAPDGPPPPLPLPLPLPLPEGPDVRLLLGRRATRLDPAARLLHLADDEAVRYDGLLVATGATARTWPPGPEPLPPTVLTLRTWEDALAVRARLAPGRRLVVVGAGFLGGEIAASARARGAHVTLVEAEPQPLHRAIGAEAGGYVAALHRRAGVELRTGTVVTGFRTGREGALSAVELSDGAVVPADTAVLALGARPATEWLSGSGAALAHGVRCDAYLRVLDGDGRPLPGVVAAGDVARVPHPLADGEEIQLGHWTNAVEQALTAAYTLIHPEAPRPFAGVPSFWSDLYGTSLRSVGLPARGEARVHELDLEAGRLEVTYHRDGRLVGALTTGRPGRLAAHRATLARRLHTAGAGPAR